MGNKHNLDYVLKSDTIYRYCIIYYGESTKFHPTHKLKWVNDDIIYLGLLRCFATSCRYPICFSHTSLDLFCANFTHWNYFSKKEVKYHSASRTLVYLHHLYNTQLFIIRHYKIYSPLLKYLWNQQAFAVVSRTVIYVLLH